MGEDFIVKKYHFLCELLSYVWSLFAYFFLNFVLNGFYSLNKEIIHIHVMIYLV